MVKLEWSTTESLQVTCSSQEPELSPLKKAVDFLPNQKALLIHTDESVPGFDEREAIYTLMPMQHPLLSLVSEIYFVFESWVWVKKEEEKTVEEKKTEYEKEREKGGPKITVRENGPGPVGVEAKTVLLSRALELTIKTRNLPAVLLITHVSTTEGGLARGTRKVENLNIEILQMN
uniref:Uncharacterized protein n=1 Tax=Chromera velia CCMP2878 TaxID=1169474 RepID=A0A0G4G012_9ALVE|eukprot:Cvel_19522.t1-p1 / transcript=Cvel_19522.t1 / gene=Cvel_19522 / organism=Chromera_velia_CCMP2878 / gene_product=hypothetical protein / transcript_product=hypothetical protein / location=Cvel_scaffold1690:3675-4199(-) / protein_length=175 / sequence_SO=supercontig / SO=protein_coding / is_pseudo=false